MVSVGGILAPIATASALVSAITAQPTRSIIWPIVNSTGQPVMTSTGQPSVSQLSGYVPIVEEHRDEMTITEHPVEQGSTISDHAYKLPALLTLRIGWSTSSPQANGTQLSVLGIQLPTLAGFYSVSSDAYINQIYAQLLSLQINRSLLTITTGRRQYTNMLLQSLSLTTDEKTAHSLIVTAVMKQVILVNTTLSSTVVNSNAQANPQATSPITSQGSQSLIPANPNVAGQQSVNGAGGIT